MKNLEINSNYGVIGLDQCPTNLIFIQFFSIISCIFTKYYLVHEIMALLESFEASRGIL